MGVSEIAREVGLHKSTISRLLATLEEAHLVERDTMSGRFSLGAGLISLAAPLISELRLLEVAKPFLEKLAEVSSETVSLNIWDGEAAVSVQQVPGGNAIQHYAPPGMRNPPHCTAAGKVFLAHASVGERSRILDGRLIRYTERTPVDRDAILEALERIRRLGYAVNAGEFVSDVGAVASVVRDIDGKAVAAITATVPMYRFGDERQRQLIALVTETAANLSRRLGYA